jgi:hypothetical protein
MSQNARRDATRPEETLWPDEPDEQPPSGSDSEERVERRRRQWREAQARMTARRRAYGGTGWAFPDDPPRGLGDNHGGRRKREETP